jgi:hypothetical protein
MKQHLKIKRHYTYRGDTMTDGHLKGRECDAVLSPAGKCIRGKNGSMLVDFDGQKHVVIARLLRTASPLQFEAGAKD